MQKTFSNKRGFSLLELSIAIVIIGLLVVGVASGKNLIKNSRLASARSLTLSSQINTMPGMILWLETSMKDNFGSSQVPDNTQIGTWYNREPSGFLTKNNLTTTPSANVIYEEDGINFIPSVKFISPGKMSLANFVGAAPSSSTVVIVFRPNIAISNSTASVIADSGASGNLVSSIGILDNRVILWASGSAVSTLTTPNPAALSNGTSYILVAYFNGSSSKVYVSNMAEVGATVSNCVISANATINPGTNPLDGITIGNDRSGGVNGMTSELSEVIVYSRILKDTERNDLMGYLSKKYKITVKCLQ